MTKKRTLYMGAFNAERLWRDEKTTALPEISDVGGDNIVYAMEELQFLFCQPEDVLFTRFSMVKDHVDYLNSIDIHFKRNERDILDRYSKRDILGKSISESLINTEDEQVLELLKSSKRLSSFAQLSSDKELEDQYRYQPSCINQEIINKVNSKAFSTQLSNQMGIGYGGLVANNSQEIIDKVEEIGQYPILLKESFGVSGKGSLVIKNNKMLLRIVKFIKHQEDKGGKGSYVIEPYLDKAFDFSTQFYISDTGDVKVLSTQCISNDGLKYAGSYTIDQVLEDQLNDFGYYDYMKSIGGRLYEEGYWGHVCIDSMCLKGGQIIPVVEINARKSMSLLKHHIDKKFSTDGSVSNMATIQVPVTEGMAFSDVLMSLEKNGMLYERNRGYGIIPLTANTIFINRDRSKACDEKNNQRGKMYYSTIGKTVEQVRVMSAKVEGLFKNAYRKG